MDTDRIQCLGEGNGRFSLLIAVVLIIMIMHVWQHCPAPNPNLQIKEQIRKEDSPKVTHTLNVLGEK